MFVNEAKHGHSCLICYMTLREYHYLEKRALGTGLVRCHVWDGVFNFTLHNLCLQAYYSSVSCGYSVSEAVAFAPPDWVLLGSKRYKVSSLQYLLH